MEKLQQETELNLTKTQLQTIINSHIQSENGLNDIFNMVVNGLMLTERQSFLSEAENSDNKGVTRKSWGVIDCLFKFESTNRCETWIFPLYFYLKIY